MIVDGDQLVDAKDLVNSGDLAYLIDRNSKFCYLGNVDQVLALLQKWNKQGDFFSGGGGGHIIEKMYVTQPGVVGPKINIVIRSEVTGEVEPTIYVLKCPI
jgi:hypothetical protein